MNHHYDELIGRSIERNASYDKAIRGSLGDLTRIGFLGPMSCGGARRAARRAASGMGGAGEVWMGGGGPGGRLSCPPTPPGGDARTPVVTRRAPVLTAFLSVPRSKFGPIPAKGALLILLPIEHTARDALRSGKNR
jgi:hypothetical protein